MRNFTIRTRLLFAAAVAALGALLLAGLGLLGNQRSSAALESMLQDNIKPLLALQRIDGSLNAVRFRAAGVLLDQFPVAGSLTHLRDTRKEVEAAWITVAAATPASTDEVELLKQMSAGWERVPALLAALEKAYVANDKAKLDDLLQADWAPVHKGFVKPMQALMPLQDAGATATFESAVTANKRGSAVSLAVALITAVVVTTIMLLTTRSVVSALRKAAAEATAIAQGDLSRSLETDRTDEVGELQTALAAMQGALASLVGEIRLSVDSIHTASSEVASGNQDLSTRTEQTASSLQQTASSMEQLTSTVRQSADSAHSANQLATSAASVAQRGGQVVSQVVTTMAEINQSSRKIADIIGTIDGIAFQTNILALNAAVEAARAGEQGRGFAVVASEVRSLAQRSAAAAKEIKGLIGSSVERVDAGSKLVGDAGRTMSEIVASVHRVSQVIAEITATSSEQSEGLGQINSAVTQLDQMTQQNSALVEQGAAAAESIKEQAHRLSESVAFFRLRTPA
ncbi:MAG: methyl-accepting chemotaxis protein [Rubrivivax sp.]|nr:methyl-accepting chemotaxis protein [Rubrivivax sp.]